MAFQPSTPEEPEDYRMYNSIGNASSLIAFVSIVEFTDSAATESTTSLRVNIFSRSDTPLARPETFSSTSEEGCLSVPATPAAYFRGASLRSCSGCRYFPSSREYDDSHPNLDAHSSIAEVDLVESEEFKLGE